jgi:Carboxylesterase family
MSNRKSPESVFMNRRTLLGGVAVVSGTLAGMALDPASASGAAADGSKAADAPNLNPPVVQVKGGKLRGFRDGRTSTFLGIPYAEAERFEMPKPVKPWDGIRSAQAWGPVPDSGAGQARRRRVRFSAPLLAGKRSLPGAEHMDPEYRCERKEAGNVLDARRRIHQRLVDGILCL